MGITVYSPHDGEPVTVRDKDVGRAVRDRENRIFYVLEKSDGGGYYGAMTRRGGEKEEQRALELEQKLGAQRGHVRERVAAAGAEGEGRRPGSRLGLLLFAVAVVGVLYLVTLGPLADLAADWIARIRGAAP
jgi:hypothetical protein